MADWQTFNIKILLKAWAQFYVVTEEMKRVVFGNIRSFQMGLNSLSFNTMSNTFIGKHQTNFDSLWALKATSFAPWNKQMRAFEFYVLVIIQALPTSRLINYCFWPKVKVHVCSKLQFWYLKNVLRNDCLYIVKILNIIFIFTIRTE